MLIVIFPFKCKFGDLIFKNSQNSQNQLFIKILAIHYMCMTCIFVTGFTKTDHDVITTGIHFIISDIATHALSRHSDNTAIDGQVYFYRWLFATEPCETMKDHNRTNEATDHERH